MKKLVPFCLVTLSMIASACGDDEGAIVPTDTPDSGGESTATTTDAGGDEESTTEGEETTVVQTEDAGGGGETSTAVELDAGGDASTEPMTDVDAGEMDSGISWWDAGDAAPSVEGDGGDASDAGEVEPTACESACATAASQGGCADNSACEAEICAIRDYAPNCVEEADAYLACMAMGTEEDFTCTNDKPTYTSEECNDPYYDAWFNCAFPQ